MGLRFSKMHGAGNDFVVIDLRRGGPAPTPALAAAIGNRHTGVGFDQLLTIETPEHGDAIARYRIWNSDGSLAQQCGNGARCVAAWLVRDGATASARFALESPAGRVEVENIGDGRYSLALGVPEFAPKRIPLRMDFEKPEYGAEIGGRELRFGAASMGNPHALIEVADVAKADVAGIGAALQASDLFPQGVNVGFVQVLHRDEIRLRVFERGAGETLACGSGASAAVAILIRQKRVDRLVQVHLPGGSLAIAWPRDDAPVRMAGPAAFVFEGEWSA
ncbi:diaminopimelate epimerase [Arenimonas oryziterrae]|uniref:Diaminopimelate epimerase n=1 Tax=Arenimonas oryziterrae DSM 21050 = YC6267 TaxID=1121015 RepID=A0A091AXN2_9GAMM|nr:diaminopimelate epimerase [Arenimonas oryziterrae]KFN44037.1 hypothetical protein N789_06380 [Arenimonas oryziterrae DSM 21050 = YC6267]